MCGTILNDRIIKARKDYDCNIFYYIHEGWTREDMYDMFDCEDDVLKYWNAYKTRFKIHKGNMYRRYTFIDGDHIADIKESLAGSELAQKYDLYPDC